MLTASSKLRHRMDQNGTSNLESTYPSPRGDGPPCTLNKGECSSRTTILSHGPVSVCMQSLKDVSIDLHTIGQAIFHPKSIIFEDTVSPYKNIFHFLPIASFPSSTYCSSRPTYLATGEVPSHGGPNFHIVPAPKSTIAREGRSRTVNGASIGQT